MVKGPTAPESNPPITPWYYQPSVFPIADITRGITTTITMTATDIGGTTVEPNYVIGQLIRILVPFSYGMRQINNSQAYVISIPSSLEVVVDIDSREYDAFVSSPTFGKSIAQIAAIGDVNSGQINTGRTGNLTYIPGSFIDIS
jgi:hypothetical protein